MNSTPQLLSISGMSCAGCVSRVEGALREVPGVTSATVNFASETASVVGSPSLAQLKSAVALAGYAAERYEWQSLDEQAARARLALLFALGRSSIALLAGGFLMLDMRLGFLPALDNQVFWSGIGGLVLLIMFAAGGHFFRSAFSSLQHKTATMDTLVSLGVLSAYLASITALIWPKVGWPCFFNEPVMLLGFVLLGRFLEERARVNTGTALKELAKLQPDTANLILENNEIREIRIGALRPGEKIQLLAGDRIPVDGLVVKGNSAIDISSLTGESLPLEASPGVELPSGSLNLESTIILEVQKIGSETAIAKIISLVEEAQARKAPIQGLADKVAAVSYTHLTLPTKA